MTETETQSINDLIADCDGPVHVTLSKELSITLTSGKARMVPVLRLEQDGPTPRSKRRPLCPPIVLDSHAEGLRMLAEAFEEVDSRG